MAPIENIPLNIKNGMRCAKKCFFIILAAAISGMPNMLLTRAVEVNAFAQEELRRFTQCR